MPINPESISSTTPQFKLLGEPSSESQMPKNKKKRKINNIQALTGLHNVVGFDNDASGGADDLMACLAEFSQPSTTTTNADNEASDSKLSKSKPSISWERKHIDHDKVEAWNASFQSWLSTGKYVPGLLPSIDEELARHFHVQDFSKFILGQGKEVRMPTFERWLLDARLEDSHASDPVLPTAASPSFHASQRLEKELRQHEVSRDEASQVVAELCRKVNTAAQALVSQKERYERTSPLKKGDRLELEDHDSTITLIYSRKKWKKPFCFPLNKLHYNKLRDNFFRIHNSATGKLDEASTKVTSRFHVIILALLLRYSSLSGGQLLQDLRGGGMQGAIHETVFDTLQEFFDSPLIEGFASPFNGSLPVFGSAFRDLDWHFGSIGSFLETSFLFKEGCCCEANPPFSPGVMSEMVDHMESQLDEADRLDRRLTFVVIVPTTDSKSKAVQKAALDSFQRMLSNEHCRKHIRLPARDHGYVEGAQHLRPTRYKQSSYDTSIVLLQSQLDLKENLDEKNFESRIKSAFVSRHVQELKKRRKQGDT